MAHPTAIKRVVNEIEDRQIRRIALANLLETGLLRPRRHFERERSEAEIAIRSHGGMKGFPTLEEVETENPRDRSRVDVLIDLVRREKMARPEGTSPEHPDPAA